MSIDGNRVITLVSVVVTEQNETPEIAGLPLEQIPPAIVEANAYNVDSVTGATVTSEAKADGTVINGLYAAGADVAEIYNNSYPLIEGVTLGAAFNGGRMIGNASAEYVK